MNVYIRYFEVKDESVLSKLAEFGDEARRVMREWQQQFSPDGLEVYFYESGAFAGFKPREGCPLPEGSALTKPDKNGLRSPKKTTDAGKRLIERVNALPKRFPLAEDLLGDFGLKARVPIIVDASRGVGYRCRAYFLGNVSALYVSVPWYDEDPEKLRNYRIDRAAEKATRSGVLDHLLWTPPETWREVKEWEMKRALEEHNAIAREKESSNE